jgi:hypothetical protein
MIGACRYYFSTSEKGDDMCRESGWVGSGGDEIRRNLEYVLQRCQLSKFFFTVKCFCFGILFWKNDLTFVFFRKYLKKFS